MNGTIADHADHEAITEALSLAEQAPRWTPTAWTWSVGDGKVRLSADPATREHREVLLGCGAALHHVRTALAALGHRTHVHRLPAPTEQLATVTLRAHEPRPAELALASVIPLRHDDRRRYSPRPVPAACLDRLALHAAREGAVLWVVQGPSQDVSRLALAEEPGLVLILGTDTDDRIARLRAGEAVSFVLLAATSLGLATCVLDAPLEVTGARAAVSGRLAGGRTPQLLIRLGWPPGPEQAAEAVPAG
ncbi:nitroreductase family protein [Prauserella flavalba]|uniref:Nitroreductase n=1 Tax=Prauserella flavalba TaxID=1477506 RepID=A0A318LPR9_9PSEU|nr:nitroreductase family protein [Prauserella flavalba]PXY36546.1 hypothetical protein BA062_14285 [Prauserella flavalba]